MDIYTALFDQNEVTRRTNLEIWNEGREEGREEGMLQMAIKSCQTFGKSFQETCLYIQSELKLTDQRVDEAMRTYWKENSQL